jgi:hypothetical protein
MKRNGIAHTAVSMSLLGLLLLPSRALAHCDSMDGPVVHAAQRALETNTIELALVWVPPSGEQEIRDAFDRTMQVRVLGGPAQELAELWFFETLVRVHRMGEGEPYTGLKPSGTEIPEGIAQADKALADGSIEALAGRLALDASEALRERFHEVVRSSAYDPTDVAAGRRHVRAYTEYMHFVEALHSLLDGAAESHWGAHQAH